MHRRQVYSEGTFAHFVTFSCYKRRRTLNPDTCKKVVIGTLASQLRSFKGLCPGFVVMPDHVHALVWFPQEHQISPFMDKWKELSSKSIQTLYERLFPNYGKTREGGEPVWQDRYYGFNIYSESKLREKVNYMHANPVRARLVSDACNWPWSSARFWHLEKSVGVPISWVP
jgi:putative transposase